MIADAVAELSQRLDSVGEWAGKVLGRLKAVEGHQQEAAGQIEALAARAAEVEAATAPVDGAIGYQPAPEQQAALFAALAEWQFTANAVDKGQVASVRTRAGDEVTYRYADIGGVSAIARSAGQHGLAHFHREIVLAGQSFIRTYLVHSSGGWISCDVPLLVRENTLISSLQQWAGASTMARRYGLFLVLGIAVGEEDDDGAGAGTVSRGRQPAAGPTRAGATGASRGQPAAGAGPTRAGTAAAHTTPIDQQ